MAWHAARLGATLITVGGVTSVMTGDNGSARFFVSYRRRADDDAQLAKQLVDALRGAGYDVFIDVDIPLGTDWSAEITRRIRWCDYLVVLLSEDSIDSEMVQGEVRLARHHRRDDGSPHVLPVRIRYEGALDYELTSYIGRLQHILWKDASDDPKVIAAILAAVRGKRGVEETLPDTGSVPAIAITDER